MYIEIDSPHTSSIGRRIDGFEGLVRADFNEDGRARVREEVGEALAREVQGISIVERETKSSQEEDE